MSIDPTLDPWIAFSEVPQQPWLPRRRGGRKLDVGTVHRWATRGLNGVKLEYFKVGGTRVTTASALQRFFAALARLEGGVPPSPPTPRQRETERQLDAAGICDSGRRAGPRSQSPPLH